MHEATQGDTQSLSILLIFVAAVIRGRSDLQVFLYLLGSGGAGKGTYCELLKHVVGEQNTWSGTLTGLENKNVNVNEVFPKGSLSEGRNRTTLR